MFELAFAQDKPAAPQGNPIIGLLPIILSLWCFIF